MIIPLFIHLPTGSTGARIHKPNEAVIIYDKLAIRTICQGVAESAGGVTSNFNSVKFKSGIPARPPLNLN